VATGNYRDVAVRQRGISNTASDFAKYYEALLFKRLQSPLDSSHQLVVPGLGIRRQVDFSFNQFFVVPVPPLRTVEELIHEIGEGWTAVLRSAIIG
jgi:hypothetical protein